MPKYNVEYYMDFPEFKGIKKIVVEADSEPEALVKADTILHEALCIGEITEIK